MASRALASLTASSALTGSESFYSDSGSQDVRVTADQIAEFVLNGRTLLDPDETFHLYVNGTTGSDSNSGLSSAAAFATIQAGLNALRLVETSADGSSVILHIADGTYTEDLRFRSRVSDWDQFPSFANIEGNIASPSSVRIVGEHYVQGPEVYYLAGMTFDATGGSWVFNSEGCRVFFGEGIVFEEGGSFGHIYARNSAFFYFVNDYTIAGGGGSHWRAESQSFIRCRNLDITITGTPDFPNGFVLCKAAVCQIDGNNFIGSATGPRFNFDYGGICELESGDGLDYFPGDEPGSRQPGCSYGNFGDNLLASGSVSSTALNFDMTEWTQFRTIIFQFDNVFPGASGDSIWMRTDSNGGASVDAGASDYDWGIYDIDIAGTPGAVVDQDAAQIVVISGAMSTSVPSSVRIELTNWNDASSEPQVLYRACCRLNAGAGDQLKIQYGGGRRATTAAINYVRFLSSGGGTLSLDYSVWGEY